MDVRFDDATEAFRQEVRTWLEANVPKEPMPSDPEGAFHYMRAWQKKMFDAGWAGIHWPKSVWRAWCDTAGASGLPAGAGAGPGAAYGQHCSGSMIVGPTLHGARHRGAEKALYPSHFERRGDLVPGFSLSPTLALIWPRCRPGRSRMAMTLSSTGRRSGPVWRMSRICVSC